LLLKTKRSQVSWYRVNDCETNAMSVLRCRVLFVECTVPWYTRRLLSCESYAYEVVHAKSVHQKSWTRQCCYNTPVLVTYLYLYSTRTGVPGTTLYAEGKCPL
jgi:hypothetical protein